MTRTWFGLLVVSLAVCLAVPRQAHASASPIAKALGNLRWGMSELEVRNALRGKTDARALESSHVDFDGGHSRHDGTMIGEEYTHGNEESLLTFKDKDADNYLFFMGGELWKWVKVYPASTFRSGFAASVKKRFGKGYDKQGEVNTGSGASYAYVEFLDRNTRLRAVDKASEYRSYVLMFEAMDTARSLSSLRSNTIRRGSPPKKSSAMASRKPVRDDDEEPVATSRRPVSPASAPGPLTKSSSSKQKQSIFADEQAGDESDADYRARKARLVSEARQQQQRVHQRDQDAKKGQVLDELAGIDDEDPLSGMGGGKKQQRE